MTTPKDATILHVESHPGYAALVREVLERRRPSLRTETAKNLVDARVALSAWSIEAILVDPDLDDSKGVDTIDRLRRAAPELPIALLTEDPKRFPAAELELACAISKRDATGEVLAETVDQLLGVVWERTGRRSGDGTAAPFNRRKPPERVLVSRSMGARCQIRFGDSKHLRPATIVDIGLDGLQVEMHTRPHRLEPGNPVAVAINFGGETIWRAGQVTRVDRGLTVARVGVALEPVTPNDIEPFYRACWRRQLAQGLAPE